MPHPDAEGHTAGVFLSPIVVDAQGHYGYGGHPSGPEAVDARQEDAALWHSLTARNLHPHGWVYTDPSLLNKPNSSLQALDRYASSLGGQNFQHTRPSAMCCVKAFAGWPKLVCASVSPKVFYHVDIQVL